MKRCVLGLVTAGVSFIGCSGGNSTPPAYYPTPTASTAPSGAQPQDTMFQKTDVPPPADGGEAPPEDPNTFNSLVDIIKKTMPTANGGSAVAVRFLNTQTGYRYSSGFVSDTGFEPFQGFPGESIAIATSDAGETFTIVMSKMRPGHFDCGKDNFALEFAAAGITGTDPKANWTDNPGGECEVDIYQGDTPGDFQGKVSGKLVSNSGDTVFTLESGYFYARRPFVAGQGGAPPPAGPVGRPQIPQGKPKFTH